MSNTVYNNAVIAGLAKDLLTTSINTRSLMTIDTDLSANAGMVKTIALSQFNRLLTIRMKML